MNRTFKKSIATLLSVLMVVSCCSALLSLVAFADAPGYEWVDEWYSANTNGTWQGGSAPVEDSDKFEFDYTAAIDDENLYLGMKFYGTLTGTAASYGNGAGSNARIWIKDYDKAYVSYNYFVDVSYTPDGFKTRLMSNTDAAGNIAAALYAYDAESYGYTVNAAVTETGYEIEVIIPVSELDNIANPGIIFTCSNNNGTNFCLHHNNNTQAPASTWTAGDFNFNELEYGADVAVSDVTVKNNVNLGAAWIDKIEAREGISQYNASLNDGVVADPAGGFSYGAPWYTFYYNANYPELATVNVDTHTGYATFDLGSAKSISEVAMQVAPAIGTASSIKVYASANGRDFDEVGTLAYEGNAIQTINAVFEKEIIAQYWKFEFVTDSMFFMVSDIMIYEYAEAQKINVGSINAYGWGGDGYPVILGYGNGNYPGAAVGGDWFQWWRKVLVSWDIDAGALVVKAIEESGGTEYTTWAMGERDFVLFCYSGNADTASHAGVFSLNVGDKVYAYGFDFTNASVNNLSSATDGVYSSSVYLWTLKDIDDGAYEYVYIPGEPGYFTDKEIPTLTASENIAVNGTLGGDAPSNSTYNGNVIDGITGATGYTNNWRAYTRGTTNSIIDLGAVVENIGSVGAYMWPANQSGIIPPTSVKFYASIDGNGWLEVGELDLSDDWFSTRGDTAKWVNLSFDKYLVARYIKMEVVVDGSFAFIAEVAVNAHTEFSYVEVDSNFNYVAGSVQLTPWTMGDTLEEILDKEYEWFNFAVLVWNSDEGAYVVDAVYVGTDIKASVDAEKGSDFGGIEIPEYGFVLGAHSDAVAEHDYIAGLEAGDVLYVYGDNLTVAETGTALENAYVSGSTIAGLTAYVPAVIPVLTNGGFAAGDVNILTRIGELDTVDEVASHILGVEIGDGTDYNYYYMIVVDADGKITEINSTLGRPAGDKGETVIPEGGYVLLMNAGSAYTAKFLSAYVGDEVVLINADLDAYAANPGATTEEVEGTTVVTASTINLSNVYFGIEHTHSFGEVIVVDPTCTDEGYSYYVCSACGYESEKTDIVAATGHAWGDEVLTLAPTCVEIGYDYNECANCDEVKVIEGTEVAATGVHNYEKTSIDGIFYSYTCEGGCGDTYVADVNGNVATELKLSHHNAYNWGTFEAMLISGDGKTVKDVIGQTPYWWIMYVVENIDGHYVATEYYKNVDQVNTTTVPAGGFLFYVYSANSAWAAADEGKLLNYYFSIDISTTWAIDTTINPARIMYALPVPAADYTAYNAAVEAAAALNADDYTPDTWAVLEAALAIEVADDLKATSQSIIDAATEAINAAILGLEGAASDVLVGDIDGNGELDLLDLSTFAVALANNELPEVAVADIDGNGVVDLLDYSALAVSLAG